MAENRLQGASQGARASAPYSATGDGKTVGDLPGSPRPEEFDVAAVVLDRRISIGSLPRAFIGLLVVAGRWQGEPEGGAGAGLRLDPDPPAVMFDDLLADRQAVCLGVGMSVGGPTGEARPPTAEVLANALLAACNGDCSVAIRLLRRTLDVLLKAQGARLSEGPSWPQP